MSNEDAYGVGPRDTSLDSLFDGRLVCHQYRQGYRFSIDSVLVSHFPRIRKGETVLDVGTGCGIIGLILLYRHRNKQISVTGLESQPDLADLARRNAEDNDFGDDFHIVTGNIADIGRWLQPESFSLAVCNPPYYRAGSGRLSRHPEAMAARHQDTADLGLFIDSAAFCVRNRGRVVVVYPAASLTPLLQALTRRRIEPKRLRLVHSYPESSAGAKLVLVEGVKNGGSGLIVEPPWYIFAHKNGPYSKTVQACYAG